MTNTRKKQVKTLAILLVAVITLAVGFSAFSSSLLMKTRLSVNPDNGTFNVKFSNASDRLDESQVVPTKSSDIFTAYNGVIDNSGIPTIANLGGEFTQPGETITYDFYTLNTGEYNAYLTDVIFNNVDGESVNKKCTSVTGANQTQVDLACNSISIKVIMGTDKITNTRSVVGHELLPNASEPVKVIIEYAKTGVLPEVEFEVEFGTISMIYNSLEGGGESPSNEEITYTREVPDTCYISLHEGYINYYNPNASDCSSYGAAGNIPASLSVTQVRVTPSQEKCEAFVDGIAEAQAENNSLPSGVEEMLEDKTTYCSNIIALLEEELAQKDMTTESITYILDTNILNEANTIIEYNYYDDFLAMLASFDIEFGSTSQNSYPITVIADDVFKNKNLTSVTLPSTLISIGEDAFYGNSISSLTIPTSVETIAKRAFYDNSISSLDLSNATSLKIIEDSAFYGNSISSLTIPTSVETIAESAFYNNSISSLDLSNATSLQSIGQSAFYSNDLLNLTIPANVTSIGNYAFQGNNSLTSLTIEGSTRTQNLAVGNNSFGSNITSLTINTSTSYLSFTNSTFKWGSTACEMATDGNLATSSCITINNN